MNKRESGDQEIKWMKTVLESGTLLDKLSATSMLIKRQPQYPLNYLRSLMKMVRRREMSVGRQ